MYDAMYNNNNILRRLNIYTAVHMYNMHIIYYIRRLRRARDRENRLRFLRAPVAFK